MYKLLKQGVQRIADSAVIPPDAGNMDWVRYQEWLAEGNTPQPTDPDPAPVILTPAEKLAASGLTVQELKTLLGIS